EVPEEVLRKLELGNLKRHDVMAHTVSTIAQRVDPDGTLGAVVSPRGDNGFLLDLPWAEKDRLEIVKQRISSLGKLEMGVVATEDYVDDKGTGVQFDLGKEKQRLQQWLDTGGKQRVLADSLAYKNIEQFNDDPEKGPLQRGNLRWYPHVINPRLDP